MNEKMKVLELLESGKITVEESVKLLNAMGVNRAFISPETKESVEEKLQQFAKDVNQFAKDVGCKAKDIYKDVEPKIKKASQTALEKAAAALDSLACNINDSLEKAKAEQCCTEECCTESCDDEPKPN